MKKIYRILPVLFIVLTAASACKTKPYWEKQLPKDDTFFYGTGYAKKRTDNDSKAEALKQARTDLAFRISAKLSNLKKIRPYSKNSEIIKITIDENKKEIFTKALQTIFLENDDLTGITRMRKDEEKGYYVMTQISATDLAQLIRQFELENENPDLTKLLQIMIEIQSETTGKNEK